MKFSGMTMYVIIPSAAHILEVGLMKIVLTENRDTHATRRPVFTVYIISIETMESVLQ